MIAVEDCEDNACGRKMAGVRAMLPVAQAASRWFHSGALEYLYRLLERAARVRGFVFVLSGMPGKAPALELS